MLGSFPRKKPIGSVISQTASFFAGEIDLVKTRGMAIEVVKKEIVAAYPTAAANSISPSKLMKNRSIRSTKNSAVRPIALVDDITTMCLKMEPFKNLAWCISEATINVGEKRNECKRRALKCHRLIKAMTDSLITDVSVGTYLTIQFVFRHAQDRG